MNDTISRRAFVRTAAIGVGVACGAAGFIAKGASAATNEPAFGLGDVKWNGRPMFLRPYHLTYIVLYYGKRDKNWGQKSEFKWRSAINRMDNEPDLKIQVVECFDDLCAGCEYLKKDDMGSVWGLGYTCRSAQKPEMVSDVVKTNKYVLSRVGLAAGETISLKELVPLLKKAIPRLELDLLGSMKNQDLYEKGLADLSRKFGLPGSDGKQ